MRTLVLALSLFALGGEAAGGPKVKRALSPKLPAGWTENPKPSGLAREFLPPGGPTDGGAGILQVSEIVDADFIAKQPDLGATAAALGEGFNKQNHWGKAGMTKNGDCAMGRYGIAAFVEGESPVMWVGVTSSKTSAWLWTWIGPAPKSPADAGVPLRILLDTPAPN